MGDRGSGPHSLSGSLILLRLNYTFFLWWTVLDPSDMLSRSDRAQFTMISFRDMATWCPVVNCSVSSRAQWFAKNSFLKGEKFSVDGRLIVQNHRGLCYDFPSGACCNTTLHCISFNHSPQLGCVKWPKWQGWLHCSLNFLQSLILLFVLLRVGSLLCHLICQPEKKT